MATVPRPARQKVSTTVAPTTLSYFEELISDGHARNLADAIDLAIERLQVFENRERLANDTAAYFEKLSPEAVEEENQLAAALASSVTGIDFDNEP